MTPRRMVSTTTKEWELITPSVRSLDAAYAQKQGFLDNKKPGLRRAGLVIEVAVVYQPDAIGDGCCDEDVIDEF